MLLNLKFDTSFKLNKFYNALLSNLWNTVFKLLKYSHKGKHIVHRYSCMKEDSDFKWMSLLRAKIDGRRGTVGIYL